MNKLIEKYRSLPVQVKATLWFTMCQAVQTAGRYLSMPFLIRLLTTEQYGIYSVFLSWIQIITVFATLNLQAGVFNNAMFKFPEQRDGYTAASQSLSAVLTAACLVIYLLFSGFWNALFGLDVDLIFMIFLQLFFTESFLLWSSRQRYEYRYMNLLCYTALLAALYMFVPLGCGLAFPQGQRLRAVIYSGVVVQAGFGLSFMIYNYIKGKIFYKREFWHYALSFNIPLIPHYLSGIILGQADRVMIRNYIGSAEAGIYSFTYNISLVINIITNSINNAIVPYTYQKLKNRDYQNLRKIANLLLIMVGGMCLTFSVIAPELFRLIATQDYYDAVFLVPVISLSSYFTFQYSLYANIEFFFEENKFITVASVIGAIANIVLNYIFMQLYGYYAAGYTTLFCYILFSISHYVFMRKVCKKHIDGDKVYNSKTIFILSILFVVLSFGMMAVYNYPVIRYLILVCAASVCFAKRQKLFQYFKMVREKKQ